MASGGLDGRDWHIGEPFTEDVLKRLGFCEIIGLGCRGVCRDKVYFRRCRTSSGYGVGHHASASGGPRGRGGQVESVVARGPAAKYGKGSCASGVCRLGAFEDDAGGSFREDGAISGGIERLHLGVARHGAQSAQAAP